MPLSRKQRKERKKQYINQVNNLKSELMNARSAIAMQDGLLKRQGQIIREYEQWERQVAEFVGPNSAILREIGELDQSIFPEFVELPDESRPLKNCIARPNQHIIPAREDRRNTLRRIEVLSQFDQLRMSRVLRVRVGGGGGSCSLYYTNEALRFMPVESLAMQLAKQFVTALRAAS